MHVYVYMDERAWIRVSGIGRSPMPTGLDREGEPREEVIPVQVVVVCGDERGSRTPLSWQQETI